MSNGATHKTMLINGKAVKLRASCDACTESKVRCSQTKPTCVRCQKHGARCVYGLSRRSHKTASRVGASSRRLELDDSSSSDSSLSSLSSSSSSSSSHLDSSMRGSIDTTTTSTTTTPPQLMDSLINWPPADTPCVTSGDVLPPVSLHDYSMLGYQANSSEDEDMSQLNFDFMDFAALEGPFDAAFSLPSQIPSTLELHDQSQSQSESQSQPQSQPQSQSQSLPSYKNNNDNSSSSPSCGSLLRAAMLDPQDTTHASSSCTCSSEVIPRLLSTPFLFQDKTVKRDVQLSQLKEAMKICEDCIRCECASSDKLAMLTVGILVGRIVEGFETTLEEASSTSGLPISAASAESPPSVASSEEDPSCPQFSWGVLQIDGEDEANLRQHLWLLHFRKLEAVLKQFNASVRLIRNTQGASVSSQVMACECIHMWLDQRAQVLRNRLFSQLGSGPSPTS